MTAKNKDAAMAGNQSVELLPVKHPDKGKHILWGWVPRASFGVLFRQSIQELFARPIFLALILIALIVGVCQVSVFLSVIIGVQDYVDEAMTSGSRLNRVEIKPRSRDRGADDRFPIADDISRWPNIDRVVARRITLARIVDAHGKAHTYSAMGLHPNDPEYQLLEFVAGEKFSGDHDQLEVILTADLLNDLFDTTGYATSSASGTATTTAVPVVGDESGSIDDANQGGFERYIGQNIAVILAQYSSAGTIKSEKTVYLTVKGIILHAEGGRQLYLPNTTHLAFDRYKRDKRNEFKLPLNDSSDAWVDQAVVSVLADFPWQDSLHIYSNEMRDVMPIIKSVSKLGYKPRSDIWKFKWALDVQDTAWTIFVPLLALIIFSVAITVFANIFTSAKLRESELALWRVLGMRRGDIVFTQLLSTIFSVVFGTVAGLAGGRFLVEQSKEILQQRGEEALIQSASAVASYDSIFAPVSEFYMLIFTSALGLGIVASLYPAYRTAKTDPAKVLQS